MATAADYEWLRADTGHSVTTLPDPEAEIIFERATSLYPTGAVHAGAREIAILELLGSATKLHRYTVNNSSHDAQQVFEHLQELLGIWQKQRQEDAAAAAQSTGGSTARFGKPTRQPARLKEYPDSNGFVVRRRSGGAWW